VDAEARERDIILRLRAVVILAAILGVAAVLLDPARNLAFVGALFGPAAWVFWRPRWGQIALWGMWVVPVVMLAVLVRLGHAPLLFTPDALLVGMVVTLVLVVMPVVRRGHRPPPLRMPRTLRVPEARVVKRRG